MEYKEEYDAMNEYYRLKHSYEKRIQDAKNKIKAPKEIKDKITGSTYTVEKTTEEKRLAIQQMKPNCIYCNKPVGTIFINSNKKLVAKCGANNLTSSQYKPCTLNIDIDTGSIGHVEDLYYEFLELKRDVEKTIIRLKMDLLFKYATEEETLEKFEESLEDYNYYTEGIQSTFNDIVNLANKTKNKPQITENTEGIKNDIQFIKETIKEYSESKEPQLILDALNKYINELIPKLSQLKELKYDYYNVEKDEYTNEHKLVTTRVSTTFLENILDNKEPTINSFVQ
tara:strand:+ start:411 stop:1262 length:852 start_codon:yes stop_codon:yes gene_type:complete